MGKSETGGPPDQREERSNDPPSAPGGKTLNALAPPTWADRSQWGDAATRFHAELVEHTQETYRHLVLMLGPQQARQDWKTASSRRSRKVVARRRGRPRGPKDADRDAELQAHYEAFANGLGRAPNP